MEKIALKADKKISKLEPPLASQKLAFSLSGPVALSILEVYYVEKFCSQR